MCLTSQPKPRSTCNCYETYPTNPLHICTYLLIICIYDAEEIILEAVSKAEFPASQLYIYNICTTQLFKFYVPFPRIKTAFPSKSLGSSDIVS